MVSKFFSSSLHQKILLIAAPMILSNITTPLMGMVDTAILGHMDGAYFLAGASVATLIITQIYWLCGFLRMTSTGLSGQAKGAQDSIQLSRCLFQGWFIGLVLALFLLGFSQPILNVGIDLANANPDTQQVIVEYFNVRIWGAPAALSNLALIGWLIGQQRAKQVLWIQVCANMVNVGLSLWLALVLEWGVFGVALATVLAEYVILVLSVYLAMKNLVKPSWQLEWFSLAQLTPLFSLNLDTFFRNLILQLCIAFLLFTGIGFGTQAAAINAIILQFFTLIALGLDGVAYAAEALAAEKTGEKDDAGVIHVTLHGLIWSSVLAFLYALIFGLFDEQIVGVITDQLDLQIAMKNYVIILILLPLLGHWCFFFDGIFVGLTRAKAMRNSMLLSGLCVFFPGYWLFSEWQNLGLWLAMLGFLLARGITLGGYFIYLYRKSWVEA